MNWIKIDHENIKLPVNVDSVVWDEYGEGPAIGSFICCPDRKEYSFVPENEEDSAEISELSHYAIIEEPKNRKYELIEDLIFPNGELCYCGMEEIPNSDLKRYCYLKKTNTPSILNEIKVFAKNEKEAVEKLLDWANDEI